MKEIRLGVFGLWRGMAYVKVIMRMQGVKITSVCDMSEERLEKAKEKCGLIKNSLLNMLSNADLALELLKDTDSGVHNVLSNILRLGAVGVQDRILENNNFKEN